MKAIVITGSRTTTTRISIDTDTKKKYKYDFEPVVNESTPACTRVNALNALVKTLEQLKESKDKKLAESANTATGEVNTTPSFPVSIYNISLVSNAITNGYALNWFVNGGKTMGDKDVTDIELNLWRKFYELYAYLITDVIMKDSTAFVNSQKNSKYHPREIDTAVLKAIGESWDTVNAKKSKLEEEYSDGI